MSKFMQLLMVLFALVLFTTIIIQHAMGFEPKASTYVTAWAALICSKLENIQREVEAR